MTPMVTRSIGGTFIALFGGGAGGGRMTFHVQGEMIGSCEGGVTHATHVRLVSSVFAIVTAKFVRSGKAPFTLWPRAAKRLLSYIHKS